MSLPNDFLWYASLNDFNSKCKRIYTYNTVANILTIFSNLARILSFLRISPFLHSTISVGNEKLQYKWRGKDYEHLLILVLYYKYLFGLDFRRGFLKNSIWSWFLEKEIIVLYANKYFIGLLFETRWRYMINELCK